jgi:serine kinase of HPr protein (carbohydrate metabolism regulator)
MNLRELVKRLNLKVFSCENLLEREFEGVYVCDLLSDVLGNAKPKQIWITLQTHKNIVAIAQLKELSAIILVKGLEPNQDTILKAEEEKIILLGSEKETFDLAGDLRDIFC